MWFVATAVVVVALALAVAASANHGLATLPGSNFEIDNNANLKLDDGAPFVDWGVLAHPDGPELRGTDLATGQNDDSYKGGVKEDTACPGETTGSIPNNKSDLLTFHVNEEAGTGGHPGFLNLAWSRVSEPSGTTLMDFEFNQSNEGCSDGPNRVRTEGDLLIEYAIDQGGARAEISGRFWTGNEWGPSVDLDDGTDCGGGPCAVGTINQTPILAADSDGLGLKQARTFGEAQIDLRLIFNDDECVSFGSAMLKSRSSDAFTSQLKDFIRPVDIDLQNCGNVIIRKQTLPDEDPNVTDFGYTKSINTSPASPNTFTLKDDGVQDYGDTVLFGTGYTVTEDVIPAGWEFVSLDCSASSAGTAFVVNSTTVTFNIDSDSDVLDCTYTNQARGSIVIEKETVTGTGSFNFTSNTLDPATWILTTTGPGEAGVDSRTFADLAPGTYDADEIVPDNWNLDSATCDDGSMVSAIVLSAGETVTCRFVDSQETGAIEITKTRKHAATPASDAHEGVTFTISGGSLQSPVEVVTNDQGVACFDGLLDGNYTVTETVPSGYVSDDAEKSVSVTAESTCGDGNEAPVSFHNTPLTDVTVSVDSQVDGGTASVIDCGPAGSTTTGANGDGSLNVDDLEPTAPDATVTCTITVDP
jgi:Prealbumin-like fold domain